MDLTSRNYDLEAQDTAERKYAYNFDYIIRHYMIRSFEPFLLNKGKVLEMGCHKGEFTEILKREFDDISVVEASEQLISATKKRVGDKIKFVHSTFEEWDTKDKYDMIFLMHTLEHLDDPVFILKKSIHC